MDSELDALLNTAKTNLSGQTTNTEQDPKTLVSSIPKLKTNVKPREEELTRKTSKQASAEKSLKPIPIRNIKSEKPDTAGKQWFDMGKPEMTTALKRDLQLLRMRHVLDPKRFYKKETAPMKYFAMGTIKEDPTEFFSNRLSKKERKRTLAEEILSTRNDYFKTKYRDIQKTKTSGRKKHQQKVRDMRA